MSGVYLYCIAPRAHRPPPGETGLAGLPVAGRACGPFTLWVSDLEAPPAPTVDAARRHNDVVVAASTDAVTPIPARFGQWFATSAALEERVDAHRAAYAALLEALAGALEFGVRILDPAAGRARPALREPATGREYLEWLARRAAARRAASEHADALGAELAAALGGLVRRTRAMRPETGPGVASVAHLVARRDFDGYRAGIEEVRARRPGFRYVVSGPWPPYTFVE